MFLMNDKSSRFGIESMLVRQFGGHIAVDSTSDIEEFVYIESSLYRQIIFGWLAQ